MKSLQVEQSLPVPLTDKELLEHGAEAAHLAEGISAVEAEFKIAKEDHKDEVAGLNRELKNHLRLIRAKEEHRPVLCEWTFDEPEKGSKSLIRSDTMATVRVAAMEGEDLQPSLLPDPDAS